MTWLKLSKKFDRETGAGPIYDLDIKKILTGNVTELNKLCARNKAESIQILLGVRNTDKASYQAVYMKSFIMAGYTNKSYTASKLLKEAAGKYGFFETDFMNSLTFQEYTPINKTATNAPSDNGFPSASPSTETPSSDVADILNAFEGGPSA